MSNLYPFVEALVTAGCLAILVFIAAVVARSRGIWPAVGWTAVGAAWFLLVWELARAGMFEGSRPTARGAALAVMLVPPFAGAAALASQYAAALVRLAAPADLITVQAYRLVAVVALIALAGEALPAWLALPVGLGDSALGLAAISVARRLRAGAPGARSRARVWNLAGIMLATFTMVATLAAGRSTGYFFSLYPLVLLPTFIAPCSLLLHGATLTALRA